MRRFRASVLAAALLLLTVGTVSAQPPSGVVYSWKGNRKTVALTFDDGPSPLYTEEILGILDEYGVKATFFVVGDNAARYGDLIRAEYEAGHEIGNHTFSHSDLRKLTYPEMCREIERTEAAVYENLEIRTRLLRPPGGMFGDALCTAAQDLDYTVVCWSVDTRDWAHTPVGDIVENVLSSVKEGDIILFHDQVGGRPSPTPEALRILIPELLKQGYRFVTVSELIRGD